MLAELHRKVSLAGKANRQCNLRQWLLGPHKQVGGPLHPSLQYIPVWGYSNQGFEMTSEDIRSHTNEGSQLGRGNVQMEVRFDEVKHSRKPLLG